MVVVETPAGNYYIDNIMVSTLDLFKQQVLKRDSDCFIIMDGAEGAGKSTKANQLANYLDPTFDISRTVFTADQFFEAVSKAKKGQCIVFDEAFGYLASRRALSKFNMDLIKMFAEMRFRNLFVILCLPSFFELDRYAAIHRSKCLIHVYEKRGERGLFMYFSRKNKKELYLKGKQGYKYTAASANFHGRFVKFFSLDKEAYDKKKRDAVFSIADKDPQARTKLKSRYMKRMDIALVFLNKYAGWSMRRISEEYEKLGESFSEPSIRDAIVRKKELWEALYDKTESGGAEK